MTQHNKNNDLRGGFKKILTKIDVIYFTGQGETKTKALQVMLKCRGDIVKN